MFRKRSRRSIPPIRTCRPPDEKCTVLSFQLRRLILRRCGMYFLQIRGEVGGPVFRGLGNGKHSQWYISLPGETLSRQTHSPLFPLHLAQSSPPSVPLSLTFPTALTPSARDPQPLAPTPYLYPLNDCFIPKHIALVPPATRQYWSANEH